MIYLFEDFELDTAKVELRTNAGAIPIERQVSKLVMLLVENHDRLVTKEEIIERIWDGRIISDSAASNQRAMRSATMVVRSALYAQSIALGSVSSRTSPRWGRRRATKPARGVAMQWTRITRRPLKHRSLSCAKGTSHVAYCH